MSPTDCRAVNGVLDLGAVFQRQVLAAVRAGFDVFLGIVPRAAAVVEEQRHENTDDSGYHEERGHGFGCDKGLSLCLEDTEDKADGQRRRNHEDAGGNHAAQGGTW